MARAETSESVGEPAGGGNSPLPRHNACRMELPHYIHTWHGLLPTAAITTASGTGTRAIHLHHNHHNMALYQSHPLPYPHPEGQDEPQTHQQLPALSPSSTPPVLSLCIRRDETGGGAAAPSALSGENTDSEREEHQEGSSRQGPLPDLLPQNERSSWPSSHHRAPREEALQEQEVRRVANRLRMIGDEYNATILHRAHPAPHWQDWRDACRGLFNFITQTLSALYRLT